MKATTIRKPFIERLDHACRKDPVMHELVFGTAPVTKAMWLRFFTRCHYWCLEQHEIAALFKDIEARDLL